MERNQSFTKDVGIICLVPDTWGPIWQTRHQILSRLSQSYHIVWIDPSEDFDIKSLLSSQKMLRKYELVDVSLAVARSVPYLPKIYTLPGLDDQLYKYRLARARNYLKKLGCKKIILYIWRPEYSRALKMFDWDASIYHIDDEYSFSDDERPIADEEMMLIKSVNQVFIHSESLFEKKGSINANTQIIPNGVDYDAYASDYALPQELAELPTPIIGYSGFLKTQLDWELIGNLCRHFPKYSFVFVGGMREQSELAASLKKLDELPNIHFLGSRAAEELPRFVKHFDICIMPYSRTFYTDYIYPLKLHEYMASGNPLISTPIKSMLPFDDYIKLASTEADWVVAIDESLSAADILKEQRFRRQAIAKSYDWSVNVEKIRAQIAKLVD